jgi:PAS domain S-box-containing protein
MKPLSHSTSEQSLSVIAEYGILDTPAETGYDDIAALAAEICGTPVAYVSFIDNHRQWFKAKLGFEMKENIIDKSFCLHTLCHGEMLIIPDLRLDNRTKLNDRVTKDPKFRFYAGAILKSPDDVVLGTLCVMDVNPHPDGLAPGQQYAMLALARQVMELLELRRLVGQRDLARADLQSSEQRYRTVFESAVDYAIVVMTRDGVVTDWNVGAVRILGWSREEMLGKSISEFFTLEDVAAAIPQREMDAALRQGHGTDERWHIRKNGDRFWASGEMMPLHEKDGSTSGFVKILRDKTKQHEANLLRDALFELSDKLQTADSGQDVLDAAVSVLQKHVAFDRAGFGRVDVLGEMIDIQENWYGENLKSVFGNIRFSDLGEIGRRIAQGEIVFVEDLAEVALPSKSQESFKALKLRAAIYMPLTYNGRTVAVFTVHSQNRQNWTNFELDLVRAITDRTHAGLSRIEAETQQQILNGELSHRLKNTLATVRAIANQTLKGTPDAKAVQAFEQRISALGAAHDILFKNDWLAGRIGSLVSATLSLHSDKSQFVAVGPDIELGPTAAVSLSLLLHELATNAVKHGALTHPGGKVFIEWNLSGEGDDQSFQLSWRERGGPAVSQPEKKGFGSKLIHNGLAGNRNVELKYNVDGFEAHFTAKLTLLRAN